MNTTRRELLAAGAAGATLACTSLSSRSAYQGGRSPWPLCLDTATIRPQTLLKKIEVAAQAGFDAIEPWDGELRDYERAGGDLEQLGERIRDAGLFVPSVIGLWDALPASPEAWQQQLPHTRERLRMIAAVGSHQAQMIPGPARPQADFDRLWAAERYHDLLEIGIHDYDVVPGLVFVEFLEGCKRLSQAMDIAIQAQHPKARVIPDVFHMHIGGSGFEGLRHIRGDAIAIFQFNDAPATPAREELEDSHRVFPGDGILPLEKCLRDLRDIGYERCVSLELYNPSYWARDPLGVAIEGREKTLAVIERALA
jgi:sugar phosphate isomerase/epimerase